MTFKRDWEEEDWQFLQNGAVNLFWRRNGFAEAKAILKACDYHLLEADCTSVEDLIKAFNVQEGWTWGGNLNAFNDYLTDLTMSASGRAAICLSGYQRLVAEDPEFARTILETIEDNSRYHLLLGRRVVGLIQTDDANYETGPLGGRAGSWNQKEWFNDARGPGSPPT